VKLFDERRAGAGLLRARQSLIAASCSLDIDSTASEISYQKHVEAYQKILDVCGVGYEVIATAAPDDLKSQALVLVQGSGDILTARCPRCGYAADLDSAISAIDPVDELPVEGDGAPLLVHTPGIKTIDDLAVFLQVSPKNNIKTLAYIAEETGPKSSEPRTQALVAFLRGDHQLNGRKLSKAMGGRRFRPMQPQEIVEVFGSPAGFLGPIGLPVAHQRSGGFGPGVIVFVDTALRGRKNLIAGANKEDFHLKNITPGKDFEPTAYADLRAVNGGDQCWSCGAELKVDAAIEIANLSRLDSFPSASLGVRVLDQNGKEVSLFVGRYRIAIERLLIAAIEQNHDKDGFWLPCPIAAFEVIVTPVSVRDDKAMSVAVNIAGALTSAGLDVILDDRDERPGVKFKDADLVGIPFRINVGKKVTEGTVEVVNRSTHEIRDASITAIAEYMHGLVQPLS
jgi:prolyl-tRNA synthetase